ncbi:MAG: phospholipase D-like domain-containing protein [Lentisphaeria bacterium]
MLCRLQIYLSVLLLFTVTGCYQTFQKLPDGLDVSSPPRYVPEAELLTDLTWIDKYGERQTEQAIFDKVYQMIHEAEDFILIDMFLFNNFGFAHGEGLRPLANELTAHLLVRKAEQPDLDIIVISDPINTVYGGMQSPHFDVLRNAGIPVIETDMDALPDSNPLYSGLWRLVLRHWGTSPAETVANPFGDGRVGLRSLFKMLNFKANHRKLIITDVPSLNSYAAIVTSANPHGASSAHWNTGLYFTGRAVEDLLHTEQAVLDFSASEDIEVDDLEMPGQDSDNDNDKDNDSYRKRGRILTENAIKEQILTLLKEAGRGTRIDLVMFYLSDRQVIKALKDASRRNAEVRIILDPNKDAFGMTKNGLPNRQTGWELNSAGIAVRWADTHGEQCHTKQLHLQYPNGRSCLLTGSANYTRRNLENYNLETVVMVAGDGRADLFKESRSYFEMLWHNTPERHFTVDYDVYKDYNLLRLIQYRLQEWSGLCTY